MGHQCIGQVYGGRVVRAPSGVMHGKTSPVFHTGAGLLQVGMDGGARSIHNFYYRWFLDLFLHTVSTQLSTADFVQAVRVTSAKL